MTDEPLAELIEVRKEFRSRKSGPRMPSRRSIMAVDGVSLAVGNGQTLGLVGESGCGKSTTARILMGIERPDSGQALFRGSDLYARGNRAGPTGGEIQPVLQNPWNSLNPRMRIGDSISEPLRAQGRDISRSTVQDLLIRVGLDPNSDREYPHSFSGGQRQRIAIARAIAPNPSLIVLDEPVSALDLSVKAQILNLLKDLQREIGCSYLIISHDLTTVAYLSDSIAVMYLGQIVELSTASQLFDTPRHPYTRALIDAAIHNTLGAGSASTPFIKKTHGEHLGCRFIDRCGLFEQLGRPSRCFELDPDLCSLEASEGEVRQVRCHFADHEILMREQRFE